MAKLRQRCCADQRFIQHYPYDRIHIFQGVCHCRTADAELKAPVLGLYGGQDQGVPVDTVAQMRAALKAAASVSGIQLYPDVSHAFYADYRPSYRRDAADDGWQRLQAWFREHGV